MNKQTSRKKSAVVVIMAVLSVIAAVVFWKQFIRNSDFSWTAQQTAYWDSAAETFLIFCVFFAVMFGKFSKRIYRLIAIALVYSVFAYLHAYLVVSIAVILYALMILLIGHLLLRFIAPKTTIKADFHLKFLLGVSAVICIVSVLSAFECGTPEWLRHIFPILFLLAIVFSGKDIVRWFRTSKQKLDAPAEEYSILNSALAAVILTVITVEACRANLGIDYDSAWYGYRSQYVLAPEGGIYDKNVLMAIVYTYAKGIETLSLVFSGLSSYGYFTALNLLFAVLSLHAVYELGKCVVKKQYSLLAVAFVALTPSIMNLSLTAKADSSTIYMQTVGLLYAVLAIGEKRSDYLMASLSVLMLTFGFKQTSIVFTTILVVIIVVFALYLRIRPKLKECGLLVLPIAAVCCLFLRTIIITGYPITTPVVPLFKSLGYYPQYPYTFPATRSTSLLTLFTTNLFWERLLRLVKLLFYPNTGDIMTLEITWWGPLFSVVWIGVILSMLIFPIKTFKRVKENRVICFITISFLVVSAASFGAMMLLETPDGNYFMLMQLLTYINAAVLIHSAGSEVMGKCTAPIVLLSACNLLLCITISAAWMLGFTPVEKDNHGYYNHQAKYVEPTMDYNGLTDMYQYLKADSPKHIIVFSDNSMAAFAMPAISETYGELAIWGADIIESADSFYDYMMYAEIDGILLDEQHLLSNEHGSDLLTELAKRGVLQVEYISGNYILLSVSEADGQADQDVLQYIYNILNNSE